MQDMSYFIELLEKIDGCIKHELGLIETGIETEWNSVCLKNIILPEITFLLENARKGKSIYKYGKEQRMLESTYVMTDSCKNLFATALGSKLVELQNLYDSL